MVQGYNYYWVLYHKFVFFPKTFKLRDIVEFKRGKSCHVSSKPQVTCYIRLSDTASIVDVHGVFFDVSRTVATSMKIYGDPTWGRDQGYALQADI